MSPPENWETILNDIKDKLADQVTAENTTTAVNNAMQPFEDRLTVLEANDKSHPHNFSALEKKGIRLEAMNNRKLFIRVFGIQRNEKSFLKFLNNKFRLFHFNP